MGSVIIFFILTPSLSSVRFQFLCGGEGKEEEAQATLGKSWSFVALGLHEEGKQGEEGKVHGLFLMGRG